MNTQPRITPSSDKAVSASVNRRREALRRIGLISAAAGGAANPMAALATGTTPRKWCYDKTKTKKVQSSVSGMNSIMMSAKAADEHYGKPCSWYSNSANLPSACSTNPKFKDLFPCATGSTDSNGVTYDPNTNNGCLFHKRVTNLCGNYGTKLEAGWVTAYCNSAALYSAAKFPYSTTQVVGFWSDLGKRESAHTFFRSYMENA
jgi:hypothetical protein